MDGVRLALELAEFMREKGDISRHVRYDEFMRTGYSIGSLARDIQLAEFTRLAYERERAHVLRRVDDLVANAKSNE